jgi:hypothetical protein
VLGHLQVITFYNIREKTYIQLIPVVRCAEQAPGEEFWLGMENVAVVLETFM